MSFQSTHMDLLGAHTSIAGGVAESVTRASAAGFGAAQIFVKSNHQWAVPPIAKEEAAAFRAAWEKSGIFFFAHSGYLINVASPNPVLFKQSVDSLVAELERAEALGLPFLVLHPGSHVGAGEEAGLARALDGLKRAIKATPRAKVKIALENTAGQGSGLGWRLEHLAWLLDRLPAARFGMCIDTAHLFAAGYDVRGKKGYDAVCRQIESVVLKKHPGAVLAWHVNDSKTGLGSRVDRHEWLGKGQIGWETFHALVADRRWNGVPKVLETPKGPEMKEDIATLKVLRKKLKAR